LYSCPIGWPFGYVSL